MAKYGDAFTVTGGAFRQHSRQTIATALPLPIVSETDLKSVKSAVNMAKLSGKQKGAMVCVDKGGDDLYIAIATGSEPADPWFALANESVKVTPVS